MADDLPCQSAEVMAHDNNDAHIAYSTTNDLPPPYVKDKSKVMMFPDVSAGNCGLLTHWPSLNGPFRDLFIEGTYHLLPYLLCQGCATGISYKMMPWLKNVRDLPFRVLKVPL